MNITAPVSDRIVSTAQDYIGRPFDYEKFNCVHFVIEVFASAGIVLPLLERTGFPPKDFHLSSEEFRCMPVGHSVFFKRKASTSSRIWTHVAIIHSKDELIHCTRRLGGKVVVTACDEFLDVYTLAPHKSL